MMSKRVLDRLVRGITKFQPVLQVAKDRDVGETDTAFIIRDMLTDIFGYDKNLDVTSEFAVRGTYCDLAIKVENKVEFMLEAKAIGIELKTGHLRQAVEYGANNGTPWVILTNGMVWRVYKIRFEQPINYNLVCEFNFAELDTKNEEHQEKLFIICKEGLVKDAREEFHKKILTVNRFMLGAIILGDDVVGVIRRELRKLSDGISVTPEEIVKILESEVLKRDVLEGDEATKARSRVRKLYGKTKKTLDQPQEELKEETSCSDKLPNQGAQQSEPKQE